MPLVHWLEEPGKLVAEFGELPGSRSVLDKALFRSIHWLDFLRQFGHYSDLNYEDKDDITKNMKVSISNFYVSCPRS